MGNNHNISVKQNISVDTRDRVHLNMFIFLCVISFKGTKKRAHKFLIKILNYFIFECPSKTFTL